MKRGGMLAVVAMLVLSPSTTMSAAPGAQSKADQAEINVMLLREYAKGLAEGRRLASGGDELEACQAQLRRANDMVVQADDDRSRAAQCGRCIKQIQSSASYGQLALGVTIDGCASKFP